MIIVFEEFDKERRLISLDELDKITISHNSTGFFIESVSVHPEENVSPETVRYLYENNYVLKLSFERIGDEE